MAVKLTKNRFIALLLKHNWDYIQSNSSSVWTAAHASKARIETIANHNPVFAKMYAEYQDYKYHDGPKPEWLKVEVPAEHVEFH